MLIVEVYKLGDQKRGYCAPTLEKLSEDMKRNLPEALVASTVAAVQAQVDSGRKYANVVLFLDEKNEEMRIKEYMEAHLRGSAPKPLP